MLKRCTGLLAAAFVAFPGAASAHGPLPALPDSLWVSWNLAPEVILPLLLVWWLYGRGLARLWRRAGRRGISFWQVAAFAAGWFALAAALVSPLEALAEALASAHMVQHMLLVAVAPPLLLLGLPAVPMLWALPEAWRGAVGRRLRRGASTALWRWLIHPSVAMLLYGAAIWLWHTPLLYQAALVNDALHNLEHVMLLAVGLLYWHTLIAPARSDEAGHGGAAVSALTTMIHTGLLGALLTFASQPWYPLHEPWTGPWGLTVMEDQQLAGLLMWVAMGFLYLIAGLCLVGAWLNSIGRRRRVRISGPADA